MKQKMQKQTKIWGVNVDPMRCDPWRQWAGRAAVIALVLLLPITAEAGAACAFGATQDGQSESRLTVTYNSESRGFEASAHASAILRRLGLSSLTGLYYSNINRGFIVVASVQDQTPDGRQRVVHGCGFSERSGADAVRNAQRNLERRTFSWTRGHPVRFQIGQTISFGKSRDSLSHRSFRLPTPQTH